MGLLQKSSQGSVHGKTNHPLIFGGGNNCMNSAIRILAISSTFLILTACGGGEGSGDVDNSNQSASSLTNNNTTSENIPSDTTVPAPILNNYNSVKASIATCIGCHQVGGIAGSSKLVLERNNDSLNVIAFQNYMTLYGRDKLLGKTIGLPFHSGGAVFGNSNSQVYKNFEAFLLSLEADPITIPVPSTPAPTTPGTPAPTPGTPAPTPGTPTPAPTPVANVNSDVIQSKCVSCHNASGAARSTSLIFRRGNSTADAAYNEAQLTSFINGRTNGAQILLDKSRGLLGHGGGALLALGSSEYALLTSFVGITPTPTTPAPTPGTPVVGDYSIESASETYRRASLYLTGKIPSRSKFLSMQGASDNTLRNEIMALMTGDGFREFLKNGANARLNSRHLLANSGAVGTYNKYYLKNVNTSESRNVVRRDLAEEPLEIIANVVMNNRPYSEILTANYTMVSQYTDESFNTGLTLAPGEWSMAQNRGQDVKTPSTFFADATGASREPNYPHAGVLSTWSFLSKYGTTATNRNRARARWTMYHFLGFDIEKSAARAISINDVADETNPTLNNPACTVCHQTLDPIAGAFKFYHERIGYKASGTDSLDRRYRNRNPGVDWYQDMLPAGFNNQTTTGDPLQWLAQRIVTDNRFATGAVKFWWFAIFGEDVLSDSAPRVQFDAQQALITNLADGFRPNLNLKLLLANMMLSNNFRAALKTDIAQSDDTLNIHMGGRRLLTGTELKNKTASLTNITWGNTNPRLEREFKLLYGGTDDFTIEKRATDLSSMMFRVAERQANEISCAVVVYDFSLAQSERRLFTQVEKNMLSETAIRNQVVVLYERLLNRIVDSGSAEVSQAYQLFLDLRQARITAGGGIRINANTRCDNRIGGSLDDPSFVMAPWRGLIAALMSDPDYLYE